MAAQAKKISGGFVIVFEGIDGVGKTTQLHLAQKALEKAGFKVHDTRNLGGTPIGEALREVTLSSIPRSPETNFFISVAIQTALAESITKERRQGKVILLDRGPLSFAAYHIYGSGVDAEMGWHYVDEGVRQFQPDLTILYQTDLKTALRRAKLRAGKVDYYAKQPKAYFERVLKGFQAARRKYLAETIDASDSINKVHDQTMKMILRELVKKAQN